MRVGRVDQRWPDWVREPWRLTDCSAFADEVERVIALLLRETGDKLNEEVSSRFPLRPN